MHSPEEQLFEQALELPPGPDRSDFLRTACNGDLKLELQVGRLIAAHESASSLLDAPVADPLLQLLAAPAPAPVADACGEAIGPYKLLEMIGEGGMGLVYMAEQEHPIRRRVALKIIKPGMDTRQVIARFEAERRALERLDHPGIARVLDAGITPAGRPYFVMELVRGISITEFCDQAQLGTADRLDLFIRVCQAVQHAHDAGIIHRDLKPANILVTMHDNVPVPKIIDFGIAKAITGRLVDHTLFTNFLQMIGTPVYMSPEQAQLTSQDVDERSDVYSLGVVLYELLTGTTPFTSERLQSVGLHEAQRIINHEDPPPPSSRLATLSGDEMSTIAARRNVDARRYGCSLKSDLDWIALRALEKDRRRRYQSAGEFLADVRRYQRHKPVHARRPTVVYRLQRFAMRRRSALMAAVLLTAFVAVGLAAAARIQRADNERHKLAAIHENEVHAQQAAVRQFAYVADIQRSHQLLERGRLQEARTLLAAHRLNVSHSDLRGFEWHYLWNRCQAQPRVLSDHRSDVFDVAWSPSGKFMATVTADGSLAVRDGATGEVLQSIDDFAQDVNAVEFNADESMIAVAEETYAASFWTWRSKKRIARIDGFRNCVARVLLTADPDLAVVVDCAWGSNTASTTLCRISTGERLTQWPGCRALAIDPTGNRMLLRNIDMRLELRSFADLETATPLGTSTGNFESASFSQDGRTMVAGSGNGRVELWHTGETLHKTFEFHTATHGRDVAITPDGTLCAACGDDGVVHVWNAQSCQELTRLWTDAGRAWSCTFSTDGALLGVTLSRGIVNLYETAALRPASRVAASLPAGTRTWTLDHSAGQLAMASVEGRETIVLAPSTGKELRRFEARPDDAVAALTFSQDDKSLWIGSESGAVREFDMDTSAEIRRVDISPGRHELIVSTDDTVIGTVPGMTFWDTTTGARLLTIPESRPEMVPRIFGFLDDQTALTRILAQEGFDLWQIRDARRLETRFERAPIETVAVSPDKSLLAVATNEPAIHLWDPATRRDQSVLLGHLGSPRHLAFSPDGRTLASSSGRNLKLWNVATGQPLFHHDLDVDAQQLVFSRDGLRLVIVGPTQPAATLDVVVLEATSDRPTTRSPPPAAQANAR